MSEEIVKIDEFVCKKEEEGGYYCKSEKDSNCNFSVLVDDGYFGILEGKNNPSECVVPHEKVKRALSEKQ